jgi:hypothetical protein
MAAYLVSSKPMMDKSSGTLMPRLDAKLKAPRAMSSFAQKIAVGMTDRPQISIAALTPPLDVKSE